MSGAELAGGIEQVLLGLFLELAVGGDELVDQVLTGRRLGLVGVTVHG